MLTQIENSTLRSLFAQMILLFSSIITCCDIIVIVWINQGQMGRVRKEWDYRRGVVAIVMTIIILLLLLVKDARAAVSQITTRRPFTRGACDQESFLFMKHFLLLMILLLFRLFLLITWSLF